MWIQIFPLINKYYQQNPLSVINIIISQALATVDKALSMEPDNARLLKLKGDILKDLQNMPVAEKVTWIACWPTNYLDIHLL